MKKLICLTLVLFCFSGCSKTTEVEVTEIQQEQNEQSFEGFTIVEQNSDTVILTDELSTIQIYRDILVKSDTELSEEFITSKGYTPDNSTNHIGYTYKARNGFELLGCWIPDKENQYWAYEILYPTEEQNKYKEIFTTYVNSIDIKEEIR